MVYQGMIGIHEIMLFVRDATEEEMELYRGLIDQGDKDAAMIVVGRVIGVTVTLSMIRDECP